jgi:hypothetical protein
MTDQLSDIFIGSKRQEGRVIGTPQKSTKFLQLTSFSLPAHPFSLRRVPQTMTVEKEK